MTSPIEALAAYHAEYVAAGVSKGMEGWAATWFKMGVPAAAAAEWARSGYLPAEAQPLIAQGITPELAAVGDEALVDEHGVIGAGVLKLQLEHPGATVLVDPDAEEPPSS